MGVQGEAGDEFDAARRQLLAVVETACEEGSDRPTAVAGSISAVLDFTAANPAAISLLTVRVFDDGLSGALRYRRLVGDFSRRLAGARSLGSRKLDLSPDFEEGLVGAMITIVAEAVRMGRQERLPELTSELVEFTLAPYVGAEEAHRLGRSYLDVAEANGGKPPGTL